MSMSNLDRLMQRQRDRDGTVVEHVCPECGGQFASHHGALIVVETCWACGGTGKLSEDQMTAYLKRANGEGRALDIS